MARRTLGTKGYGPVKKGNWGYGYQIECGHVKEIGESCYNCIHCTDNKHCGKTGRAIPDQGKGMWRDCKYYKNNVIRYLRDDENTRMNIENNNIPSLFKHISNDYEFPTGELIRLLYRFDTSKKRDYTMLNECYKKFKQLPIGRQNQIDCHLFIETNRYFSDWFCYLHSRNKCKTRKKKNSNQTIEYKDISNFLPINLSTDPIIIQNLVDLLFNYGRLTQNDSDLLEMYNKSFKSLNPDKQSKIDSVIYRRTGEFFSCWYDYLTSGNIHFYNITEVCDSNKEVYSPISSAILNKGDIFYRNVLVLCLKKGINFSKLILQASYEIAEYQIRLCEKFDKEFLTITFTTLDFVTIYMYEIARLLNCNLSDIFCMSDQDVLNIMKSFLKTKEAYEVNYIFKKQIHDKYNNSKFPLYAVFNEYTFDFSNNLKTRKKEIYLCDIMSDKGVDEELYETLCLLNDEKDIMENTHLLNRYPIPKNRKEYKHLIMKNYSPIYSILPTDTVFKQNDLLSSVICLSIKSDKDFTEIDRLVKFALKQFRKKLKMKIESNKIIKRYYSQVEYAMMYFQLMANYLNCDLQEIFELTEEKQKNIIYDFLSRDDLEIKDFDNYLEAGSFFSSFSKIKEDNQNGLIEREEYPYYWSMREEYDETGNKLTFAAISIRCMYQETFFCYFDTEKHFGFLRDVPVYVETKGEMINYFTSEIE